MSEAKRIVILAGPNGAGKTTFAREFLPREGDCPTFINADLIAAGLSPFRPETQAIRAARIMLELMAEHLRRGESFAFETTLAARNFGKSIPEWRRDGYRVSLHFLKLPSTEAAMERVAARVRQGGHHVPEDVIRRRFISGWQNFESLYRGVVNDWYVWDASGTVPLAIHRGVNE
jgi:predicted ABC-type ATPase